MPWFLQLCLPSVRSICTHYSPFCCCVFRSVVILLGFVFFVILFVFFVLLVDSSELMYNILLASCLERLSPLIHWPIVSWKIWSIYTKLILILLLPLWAGLVGTDLCEAFPKCLCFTSRVSSAASQLLTQPTEKAPPPPSLLTGIPKAQGLTWIQLPMCSITHVEAKEAGFHSPSFIILHHVQFQILLLHWHCLKPPETATSVCPSCCMQLLGRQGGGCEDGDCS